MTFKIIVGVVGLGAIGLVGFLFFKRLREERAARGVTPDRVPQQGDLDFIAPLQPLTRFVKAGNGRGGEADFKKGA